MSTVSHSRLYNENEKPHSGFNRAVRSRPSWHTFPLFCSVQSVLIIGKELAACDALCSRFTQLSDLICAVLSNRRHPIMSTYNHVIYRFSILYRLMLSCILAPLFFFFFFFLKSHSWTKSLSRCVPCLMLFIWAHTVCARYSEAWISASCFSDSSSRNMLAEKKASAVLRVRFRCSQIS